LELEIDDKSSFDFFDYLTSEIDFSKLIAVKLDITWSNQTHNDKTNISMKKICSIIPRNVKQVDVVVQNVNDMITILTQLTHLYTIVFQLPKHFSGRPQEIIAWLKDNKIDFMHHYEYKFLSIWLGKMLINGRSLPITSPREYVQQCYRYNDF
jgi:hypothetical protein